MSCFKPNCQKKPSGICECCDPPIIMCKKHASEHIAINVQGGHNYQNALEESKYESLDLNSKQQERVNLNHQDKLFFGKHNTNKYSGQPYGQN